MTSRRGNAGRDPRGPGSASAQGPFPRSPSAAGGGPPGAAPRRVIYVHGIGAQADPVTLKRQYDAALFGRDVGDRSRLAYWADILHPLPTEAAHFPEAGAETAAGAYAEAALGGDDAAFADDPGFDEAGARRFRERLEAEFADAPAAGDDRTAREAARAGAAPADPLRPTVAPTFDAKILPPSPLRRRLTRWVTGQFIHDVEAYLFHPDTRGAVRDRLRALLVAGGGPYAVVSHSLGTVVAYDVLHEIGRAIDVPLWVTLGSPLGIEEVKDHLAEDLRANRPRRPTVPPSVGLWRNFADPLDPVALDKSLGDDFAPRDERRDVRIVNEHRRRLWGFNPHSGVGYLGDAAVRETVRNAVRTGFDSPTAGFVVAGDLAAEMAGAARRIPVLIELAGAGEGLGADLAARGVRLAGEIAELAGGDAGAAQVDVLRRYVAADLTPREIAELEARHENLGLRRLWKDSEKRALLTVSGDRLQANTAHAGYRATGRGIGWAVLDTGIRADHPHFVTHQNVAAVWNCTRAGRDPTAEGADDRAGHGTHVAGIIAGTELDPPDAAGANGRRPHVGMAPEAKLHVYKVLGDDGRGRDSWIVKALDHVARVNENAPGLKIHGVNLSLGGAFDPEVYGCGHSPICRELRRLWRSGVVVCVAAGNEGTVSVEAIGRGATRLTVDLSIGDPANLEEAIAVGSVHRESPFLHGVSYFSSRGPTADGRPKPDLVAPGEKIESCGVDFDRGGAAYVPQSGTSMACPHVSGLAAAFLSVRREFVGRPDDVKRLLCQHALDLGRDRCHQGAGVPNLIHMLAGT